MRGSVSQAQAWAMRAGSFVGGAGAGGSSATSTLTRERDVAAYEAMKASKPDKPPAPKVLELDEVGE